MRNKTAMTKKNHEVARCDFVSPTWLGRIKLSDGVSDSCQPMFLLQRPYIANITPVPPMRTMRDSTDQTTMSAVGRFATVGSAGQLFVYE